MKNLEEKLKGCKVRYINNHKSEVGIIKDVGKGVNQVYVVFDCGEDWSNYKDYTAKSTSLLNCKLGWDEYITKEMINIFDDGKVIISSVVGNRKFKVFKYNNRLVYSLENKNLSDETCYNGHIKWLSDCREDVFKKYIKVDDDIIKMMKEWIKV